MWLQLGETKKNEQTKDFYKNAGFSLVAENEKGHTQWMINLENYPLEYPEFIEVKCEAR